MSLPDPGDRGTTTTTPTGSVPGPPRVAVASHRAPRPAAPARARRRPLGVVLAATFKYTSLVVASVVTLLPLVVLTMASLKTKREFQTSAPFDLPEQLQFENYAKAFTDGKMALGFLNTAIILAVAMTGTIIIAAMTAYAIDRFEFRFKKTVVALFLLATLVPGVTTQVATFQVVNNLGLYNTRWAAIALFMGTDIISIYIFLQFMRSIPRELDEAATLEGAGHVRIFWQIVFPLLKPAIATVLIIKGFATYNEFYIPFLYLKDSGLQVVSTSLFKFTGPYGTQWEVISAGVVLTIIPTLIIFVLLQKFIYNGFSQGATK